MEDDGRSLRYVFRYGQHRIEAGFGAGYVDEFIGDNPITNGDCYLTLSRLGCPQPKMPKYGFDTVALSERSQTGLAEAHVITVIRFDFVVIAFDLAGSLCTDDSFVSVAGKRIVIGRQFYPHSMIN